MEPDEDSFTTETGLPKAFLRIHVGGRGGQTKSSRDGAGMVKSDHLLPAADVLSCCSSLVITNSSKVQGPPANHEKHGGRASKYTEPFWVSRLRPFWQTDAGTPAPKVGFFCPEHIGIPPRKIPHLDPQNWFLVFLCGGIWVGPPMSSSNQQHNQ